MRPLASQPDAERARVELVAFDLDDTFLSHGQLEPDVYAALHRLQDAGKKLVIVTGRPLGWAQVLARLFPVLGVVAENGAISTWREADGRLAVERAGSAAEHAQQAQRLEALRLRVQRALPQVRLSEDMPTRRTELTFDVAEHERLDEPAIAALCALLQDEGAQTIRSSVHVHASFVRSNKIEGLMRFLRRRAPEHDAGSWPHRMLFAGDSGNDAPCFASLPITVGVANVREHLARIPVPPRYVTRAARGQGFRELAEHLLA